jgi:hypothetical protein
MHNFTFFIKHIDGNANKVIYDLSRRILIVQEFQVETLGFEHLKEMYREDTYFKEAYEACKNPFLGDRIPWKEYLIQDGLLFKWSQLCISRCSMRDNLSKEKHSGSLAGNFGHDKIICTVEKFILLVELEGKGEKFCEQMKNFRVCKRKTTEHCFVSSITNSRKATRYNQYGFCIGIAKNPKRE